MVTVTTRKPNRGGTQLMRVNGIFQQQPLSRHCQFHGFHWLASFTDVGFCCTPTENCWQVLAPSGDPSMLTAAFLLPLEVKKTAGKKLPAVSRRTAATQLGSAATDPKKAISALLYSPSSRKTRSRSLPPCRDRVRSRCQWSAHRNTGSPGWTVQSKRGSNRTTRFR